jgi:hypothetical protein
MLRKLVEKIKSFLRREKPVSADGYDAVKQIKEMAKLGGRLVL